ncbi:MAG: hypothetical protein GX643_16770 [Acidimicrobiales bacterium]|nr:hypothetical protein [Acidimicrobiales bacterium]
MSFDPFAPADGAAPGVRFDNVGAHHEDPHPKGDGALWSESWYLDFVDPDRGVAGYVRLGLQPNQGVAWYWACLVGPDRPLVTVIDNEIRPPARGLEIRTEGLWANYTVETALDHVSVGVEAFAISTSDPTDVYGGLRGDRVPFGLDLEWETDGSVYAYPGTTRYEIPCRVHGEIMLADGPIHVDCLGQRDHSWGERDWWAYSWSWTAGWLSDGTRFHGTSVDVDDVHLFGTGYLQGPDGTRIEVDEARRTEVLGPAGLPERATWQVHDLAMDVEPVAFAPVEAVAADGRVTRFPRAWCRFTAADGRTGHGWTEWNQPQA